MLACYSGFLKGLQCMLETSEVDLMMRDNHGLNCEMQAVKNGYLDCVRLIHKYQKPQLSCDRFHRNPLHYAYYYEYPDIVDYYAHSELF